MGKFYGFPITENMLFQLHHVGAFYIVIFSNSLLHCAISVESNVFKNILPLFSRQFFVNSVSLHLFQNSYVFDHFMKNCSISVFIWEQMF